MRRRYSNRFAATLLLAATLFYGCDDSGAKTGKLRLDYPRSVAAGSRTKISVIPGSNSGLNSQYEWKAEHGKFEEAATTGLSNFYVAPGQTTTDTLTVTITQGGTALDIAADVISVEGSTIEASTDGPAGQKAAGTTSTTPKPGAENPANSVGLDTWFAPAGWMGDAQVGRKYVQVDNASQDNPHSAPTCYKWTYRPGELGWAAVGWQFPEGNFGNQPGRDLTGFSKVTVWLRGERGNEMLVLKAGGHTSPSAKYPASFEALPVSATLSREWQKFEVRLSGKLSNIPCGFVWVATRQDNPSGPVVFYLDDLQVEK